MKRFWEITNDEEVLLASELEAHAPAVRLDQGKPCKGQKAPLDLDVKERTRVKYPLDGGSIELNVTRVQ